jgi:hypothetical protein
MPNKIKTAAGTIRWQVRVRVNGRQVSRTFDTKREALAWEAQAKAAEAKGTLGRSLAKSTFGEHGDVHLGTRQLRVVYSDTWYSPSYVGHHFVGMNRMWEV